MTKHKQDRNNKRQEETNRHKANKRTTVGTPVSQPRKEEEKNKTENYTGYPRSSQQPNKVQNWFVQQAQT
jgi:hypothetical protein